ncbi:dTDP-4-dehydrorhamnose 3,5-epimerase [Planktosalinus lacus]|nr:dTDP-4-dehydrorhamnose 3,5-epimerase [Planktosalinus lacus]
MKYIKTPFENLLVCQPTLMGDSRGYFYETFNEAHFKKHTGLDIHFVQDNQSLSKYGVLRGLHMQGGAFAQAKLVRCFKGQVLDVVVDMRKDQPTFGKSYSILLSEENHTQLFIPRGFAHGFSVLSDEAVFVYKCDNFYHRESEIGVAYNDPQFKIDWKIPEAERILSEKDQNNPAFAEAVKQLYAL